MVTEKSTAAAAAFAPPTPTPPSDTAEVGERFAFALEFVIVVVWWVVEFEFVSVDACFCGDGSSVAGEFA